MKRIALIYINDVMYSPFLKKYIDIIEREGFQYTVIYWDRKGRIEESTCFPNSIVYYKKSREHKSRFLKIFDFLSYRKFLKKLLNKEKYDKVIILTTFSGILIYDIIIKKFKDKYVFDFRDLSYEFLPIYSLLVKKMIFNSYFTAISSRGFLNILPESNKYIMSHNSPSNISIANININRNSDGVIKILYIGVFRGEKYTKKIMDIFGNDTRFILYIIGKDCDNLRTRKYSKSYKNIIVEGTYDNLQKDKYIEMCDMLLYNYDTSFINNYALANKFYDGLRYVKPLIGNSETYSGKLIASKRLGISLSFSDDAYTEKIYQYIMNLSYSELIENIKNEIRLISIDETEYMSQIKEFVTC